VRPVRERPRAALGLALVLALAASRAVAWPSGDVTDLLQPGSRPAVGLGGDPFRSALEEAEGWSGLALEHGPALGINALLSEPAFSSATGGRGRLSGQSIGWSAMMPLRVARRDWLLGARLSRPQWQGSWRSASGSLEFGGFGTRFEAGLRVQDLLPGLTLDSWLPLDEPRAGGHSSTASAGFRYQPGTKVVLAGNRTRSRVPEPFRAEVRGDAISAPLNLSADRNCVLVRLVPFPALEAEATLARSRYGPIEPRDLRPVYELALDGSAGEDQASMAWSLPRLRLLGRWTRGALDVRGNAYWGGQRFGELSEARADLESRLLGLELRSSGHTRAVLDFEQVQARASARAEVETWPFSSTVEDLLGVRWIGLGQGKARWARWHAGQEWSPGRTLRGSAGLTWYDIWPEGAVASWRPAFLVFGRADSHTDALSARRLQLAAVSFGLKRSGRTLDAELALRQFVFARAFRSAPSAGTGDATSDATAPSLGLRHWPGGTRLEFTLTHRL
jgi:hypothetical protein